MLIFYIGCIIICLGLTAIALLMAGEAMSKGSYIFCIVFLCAAFIPATFIVGILIDIGVI